MSNDQLRAIVIEKVLFTLDEATLHAVLQRLTDAESEMVGLTSEQEASVEVGLADLAGGRVVSDGDLGRLDSVEWR